MYLTSQITCVFNMQPRDLKATCCTEKPCCGHSTDSAGLSGCDCDELKAKSPAKDAEKPSLCVPVRICQGLTRSLALIFGSKLQQPRLSLLASGVLLMSIWPELTNGIAMEPLLALITFPRKNGRHYPCSQGVRVVTFLTCTSPKSLEEQYS